MKLTINKMGRAISVAALGLGLVGSAGCDEAGKACGLECPENGIAEGNASISGYAAIDSFFSSVVRFKQTAGSVSAGIQAELDAIQAGFQISDADLKAEGGDLGAAIAGKLDADFKAKLTIDAEPARCEVDASVTVEATVDCQVEAGCKVDPGMVSVECKGECTAEANVMAECSGEAKLECEVTGPSVECSGTCEGSCELTVAAKCEGTCNGTCDGTCSAMGGNGSCAGSCDGMCKGSCEANAGASCSGKCSGSCKAEAPMGGCDASAKASCKASADASVECKGTCEGDFEPPKADCKASASCESSAKADAKFNVQCSPPRVDIKFTLAAALDAKAQADFDFAIGSLKAHLPSLLASIKKGKLVVDAGVELAGDGKKAIEGTLSALADGDVGVVAAFRIASCVPDELKVVGMVITDSGKELSASAEGAAGVTAALGM